MKKILLTLMCCAAMLLASHRALAQEITIILTPGWNWISYPNAEAMTIASALGDFVPMQGDIIKSMYGSTKYSNGRWAGSVTYFIPGWGYKYYSKRTEDVEFVFAQAASSNVATATPTDVTAMSAVAGGMVILPEGSHVFLRGVCWGTEPNPDIDGNHTTNGTSIGSFTTTLEGLSPNTTYYVRAYAVSDHGLAYGNEVTFTTQSGIPMVTTAAVTDILGDGATCGGTVTDGGGLDITARGVCWSTSQNPTLSDSHTTDGTGTGSFVSTLTGLTPNATYYVRAYATTSQATSYGEEMTFTTMNGIPAVSTAEVTGITATTATCGGTVTTDGGLAITARGVCWSTSPSPTVIDQHSTDGTGTGSFSSTLTGLTPNTIYYVRAYATNSYVTVYGNQQSFTTESIPSYTVTVSSNPTEGGTATGEGTYEQGQDCTVSAMANAGYAFTNWTENGNVVSTNANYTFTVNANRTLVANFTAQPQTPTGAINGLFSVSASQQVYFSQGNLQYQASTNTWKFADNQYDYVGSTNSNISSTYSGWIDLFGWGTSGWNSGNTYYHPWDSNNSGATYGPPGQYNLTGSYANADWGVYNSISNGGNQTNQWRTLTRPEWTYVFNTRTTASGIRYAKANVNNVNGLILLPDDWSSSTYSLSNTNNSGASFSSNTISASQWNTLEQAGAVFLPAAGYRDGSSVYSVGSGGFYWSASYYGSYNARCVVFDDSYLSTDDDISRYYGQSVRLVCVAEN